MITMTHYWPSDYISNRYNVSGLQGVNAKTKRSHQQPKSYPGSRNSNFPNRHTIPRNKGGPQNYENLKKFREVNRSTSSLKNIGVGSSAHLSLPEVSVLNSGSTRVLDASFSNAKYKGVSTLSRPIEPQVIRVVNGNDPSVQSQVLLNTKTDQPWEELVRDLGRAVKLSKYKLGGKMTTLTGRMVNSYSQLRSELETGTNAYYVYPPNYENYSDGNNSRRKRSSIGSVPHSPEPIVYSQHTPKPPHRHSIDDSISLNQRLNQNVSPTPLKS